MYIYVYIYIQIYIYIYIYIYIDIQPECDKELIEISKPEIVVLIILGLNDDDDVYLSKNYNMWVTKIYSLYKYVKHIDSSQ
jgi:hypothetical protein